MPMPATPAAPWRQHWAARGGSIPPIARTGDVESPFNALYLIVVFIGFCVQNLPDAIRQIASSVPAKIAIGLILATFVLLALALRTGERRWRAAGMDLDDRQPADGSAPPAGL